MTSQLSRLDLESIGQSVVRSSDYSVTGMAKCCHLSKRNLQRIFRASFQKAPHTWLSEVRMQHAVVLLMGGATPNETSITLGYRDPANFTRAFKLCFRVTPSQYVLERHRAVVSGQVPAPEDKRHEPPRRLHHDDCAPFADQFGVQSANGKLPSIVIHRNASMPILLSQADLR